MFSSIVAHATGRMGNQQSTVRSLRLASTTRRRIQTKTVTDNDVARLAAQPLHPLTLADLCKEGRPPLSEPSLFNSANFTLSILPARLAHRIQSLRSLPYIVVANPHVSKIHDNYVHSLSTLLPFAEKTITSLEEEVRFTECMADLVQTHANTIAILARGFLEARKYISPEEITSFLDEHLRARIGTRLIAEQHIAMHMSSRPHLELSHSSKEVYRQQEESTYIGVIDTALKPASVIRNCEATVGEICELNYGVRPTVRITGDTNATIANIPMHLNYILTELLKNSFRATIEEGMEKEPIEITIAPAGTNVDESAGAGRPNDHKPGSVSNVRQGSIDAVSDSQKPAKSVASNIEVLDSNTPGITLRIRDRGGGIHPENLARLWEYGFTTFNEDEINEKVFGGSNSSSGFDAISGSSGNALAGLGYGLPLARAYAEYFGGGIRVQSLYGWGCDVYLSLKGIGKI